MPTDLNAYLALIERERQRRPAEAMLADEIHRLREQLRLATIDQAMAEADANDARPFLAIERTHIDGPEEVR